jgi:hypothetical protein
VTSTINGKLQERCGKPGLPVAHFSTASLRDDEAGVTEDREMFGDGGRGHPHALGKVGGATGDSRFG